MFLAAAVQLSSTSDADANWASARELVRRAAGYGAAFVATPENTNFLGPHEEKVRRAEPLDGPTVERFSGLAARARHPPAARLLQRGERRRAALLQHQRPVRSRTASVLATYRKIHLFDVDVSDEVRFRESDTVVAGEDVVVAETPLGRLGLSICYDLRFPELYRRLADGGAEVLLVPAAFTLTTGKDHWYPLLRARAIETQCWLLAPAQHGRHDDGGLRESYGHAAIVDPWGQVVAAAPEGPGLALAEVDLDQVLQIRRSMPVAQHRRL